MFDFIIVCQLLGLGSAWLGTLLGAKNYLALELFSILIGLKILFGTLLGLRTLLVTLEQKKVCKTNDDFPKISISMCL